ncbi:MAG: TonB-dependent receptor [Vicinamibacterales bacterium]
MIEKGVAKTLSLLLLVLWLPVSASAQSATSGAIAGVVRDATGAVLPGVTVEAASPALIEKVRAVVADDQGNYKIIDLRPGTYTVTFTLPGFSTFKREGIELTSGFTATVNSEMKIGGLEETVTVTGGSPIVDVQNSRAQNLLKAEVLDALPTGSRSVMQFAHMTLGATASSAGANDVGGDKGEAATGITIHGSRGDDGRVNLDGMNINNFNGGGGGRMRVYYPNMVAVQEVTIDTGGNTAESEVGGANQNLVPREGSNIFSIYGTANWTNSNFTAASVSDDLIARGARAIKSVKVIFDYGAGVGGPIKKDTLWFYATNRWWGAQSPGVNNYFNVSPSNFYWEPDLARPAHTNQYYRDTSSRFTWQASSKDKVAMELHRQDGCSCWLGIGRGALESPESTADSLYRSQYLAQATWNRTVTNKLLLQGSANFLVQGVANVTMASLNRNTFTFATPLPDVRPVYRVTEQIGFTTPLGNRVPGGFSWGGLAPGNRNEGPDNPNNNYNQRFIVSYVTGSHSFKGGVQTLQGTQNTIGVSAEMANADISRSVAYTLRAGLPISLTQAATPFRADVRLRSVGLFLQDQWTLKRLTMNLGVRFDQFRGRAPALSIPAGPFLPARNVAELNDVPNFKDITPRFGASYDVFGNGKTAIKGAFGRYLLGQGAGLTLTVAPAAAIVQSVTRTWSDSNGNFSPDCDLRSVTANGECGPMSNSAFGQPVTNLTLTDGAREGWGVREYNYQTALQLQHELRPGLGLNVGYFRTWWRNQTVTVNTLVSPADFTPYCITAPTDARLGDVSGSRVCGFYDVVPEKRAAVNQEIRLAKSFGLGLPEERFNGLDMALTGRWGRGAFATGGVSLGQQNIDFCYANNNPELTPQSFPAGNPRSDGYCNIKPSWWNGSQIKGQVAYPLPLGLQLSGTFKNLPGIPVGATLPLTNATVAPALGRNLAACAPGVAAAACTATVSVALLPSAQGGNDGNRAAQKYDDRVSQIDTRVTKTFRFGSRRIQAMVDLYNVFNNRPVQGINANFGASWLQATQVLTGRLLKFGTQIDW